MQIPTHMDVAKDNLNFWARGFLAEREGDLWEEETRTLPWTLARHRRKCRAFADKYVRPRALEADLDPYAFDKEPLIQEYVRQGFATELMPPPFGTLPVSAIFHGIYYPSLFRLEEIMAACGGIGLMLMAHDLGVLPFGLAGSWSALKKLRDIYKELKAGEPALAAYALTEPGAGSDMEDSKGAMKAKVVTRAHKVPGGYSLSGRKCFISGADIARYITLFACLGDEGIESTTCFLIEPGMEGFSIGRREKKMGQRASDACELILEEVFVPEANRIGAERAGWAINRNVLNWSRVGVGAIALGIARGALESCIEFCRAARLGNKPLIELQDVQLELAEMMSMVFSLRAFCWYAVRYKKPFQAVSSMLKSHTADVGVEVCRMAMDLMGDHAYVHGNSVEKRLRDVRLNQIYEGANQINRLAIIEDVWETDVVGRREDVK
jgi:alkylation response protein AidB-like acyl-CoA dehydrogenase